MGRQPIKVSPAQEVDIFFLIAILNCPHFAGCFHISCLDLVQVVLVLHSFALLSFSVFISLVTSLLSTCSGSERNDFMSQTTDTTSGYTSIITTRMRRTSGNRVEQKSHDTNKIKTNSELSVKTNSTSCLSPVLGFSVQRLHVPPGYFFPYILKQVLCELKEFV